MIEEDPLFRKSQNEESKENKQKEGEKMLASEALKIDLKKLFDEVTEQYSALKQKVNHLITQNKLNQ